MDGMVKQELEEFLSSHLPQQTLDVLDEIVFEYLTNVLEMLDQDDSFNIDDFTVMMDAYIPGFCDIPSDDVFSWMVGLADKLRIAREIGEEIPASTCNKKCEASAESKPSPVTECTCTNKPVAGLDKTGLSQNKKCLKMTKTEARSSRSCNVTKDDGERESLYHANQEHGETMIEEFNSTVKILCEMFPSACSLEVRRCLTVANGDADEAARLMLISRDSSESLDDMEQRYFLADSNPKPHQVSAKRQNLGESEQEQIKSKLVSRYGFVEVTDDQRNHRPSLPKQDGKKLIRYRDNQVVSTKGERFILERKRETDEEKKTYINLKPARKYRFH